MTVVNPPVGAPLHDTPAVAPAEYALAVIGAKSLSSARRNCVVVPDLLIAGNAEVSAALGPYASNCAGLTIKPATPPVTTENDPVPIAPTWRPQSVPTAAIRKPVVLFEVPAVAHVAPSFCV